jgi:hypothetical protein
MTTSDADPNRSPEPAAEPCRWCSGPVRTIHGRIEPHRQALGAPPILVALAGTSPGAPCPLSRTVPWRRGTPDLATVRRHVQAPVDGEEGMNVAYFQVRWMRVFLATVCVSVVDGKAIWGFGLPPGGTAPKGVTVAGVFAPPATDVPEHSAWDFRPLDLHTSEPRAWVDRDEDAELSDEELALAVSRPDDDVPAAPAPEGASP